MADVTVEAVQAKLKRKLGLDITDDLQDDLLTDLIEDTMSHFKLLTESLSGTYPETIPIKYEFIIKEVAERRFNRIGSEGMTTESVDGHSVNYEEQKKDFDPYLTALENSLSPSSGARGRVLFL